VRHAATVPREPASADAVSTELLAAPVGAGDVRALAPSVPGLYAWWAAPDVLPTLAGPVHPSRSDLRLLYIGIAMKLRSRLASDHLGRSGSSTLRRTLAGFLLDDEQFRTRWTDHVVLVDDDERRLTAWMVEHLHVTWSEHPTPRDVERTIIQTLRPPLDVEHASGPVRDLVRAARQHYRASAGTRSPA
jgi:hypothetical protein